MHLCVYVCLRTYFKHADSRCSESIACSLLNCKFSLFIQKKIATDSVCSVSLYDNFFLFVFWITDPKDASGKKPDSLRKDLKVVLILICVFVCMMCFCSPPTFWPGCDPKIVPMFLHIFPALQLSLETEKLPGFDIYDIITFPYLWFPLAVQTAPQSSLLHVTHSEHSQSGFLMMVTADQAVFSSAATIILNPLM